MSGTHGDLFREIGALVMAAHEGQCFDLTHTADELARCYINLGVPADSIARAITRSMAAVGVSMEIMRSSDRISIRQNARAEGLDDLAAGDASLADGYLPDEATRSASVLFPSGVRLAVLS